MEDALLLGACYQHMGFGSAGVSWRPVNAAPLLNIHSGKLGGGWVGGGGLAGKLRPVASPDARVILNMVGSPARVMAHAEVASVATRGPESCRVAQGRPDCPVAITNTQHPM